LQENPAPSPEIRQNRLLEGGRNTFIFNGLGILHGRLPNVLALPHMGSATDAARIAMGEKVLENIAAFARGEAPPDRVRL